MFQTQVVLPHSSFISGLLLFVFTTKLLFIIDFSDKFSSYFTDFWLEKTLGSKYLFCIEKYVFLFFSFLFPQQKNFSLLQKKFKKFLKKKKRKKLRGLPS
jgi:hypothetical protein